MTPTSATKTDSRADVAEVLSLISRRASHEVRNALNAVSVNVEVVRSRLAKPGTDLHNLEAFAERASRENDRAASLTAGLADLTRLFARAAGEVPPAIEKSAGSATIRLPVRPSDDTVISPELKSLGALIGVTIRLDGPAVIFTIRD